MACSQAMFEVVTFSEVATFEFYYYSNNCELTKSHFQEFVQAKFFKSVISAGQWPTDHC